MTKLAGTMALVSTVVGGAFVSLPHSMYYSGIPLGTCILFLVGVQTTYTVPLYLAAIDYMPGKPESLFEAGYVLFKRASIFAICFVVWFNSFGLMIIYFILFAKTLALTIKDATQGKNLPGIVTAQWFYAMLLGLCLIPVILKK